MIVCAAIRNGELIICGARHMDSIMVAVLQALGHEHVKHGDWEQGFIDQHGKFYTREDARQAFIAASEEHLPRHPTKLFSEDLY